MVQGGIERRPVIWNGLRNIMKTSNNILKIFFEAIFFFGLYFYTFILCSGLRPATLLKKDSGAGVFL